MKWMSLLAATMMLQLVLAGSVYAAPSLEIVLTSGISANLKPRNNLSRLPKAKGEFTIYLKWKGLPTKKKWGFLNGSDPVNYKTMVYDGAGKKVSEEGHSFTPDASDTVSWVEQTMSSANKSGQWTIIVQAFGRQHKKGINIYD